jgi:hypothetical protein
MKIIDLVVKKMDHSDSRFPDPAENFTDVYLLTCKLDDGSEQECPYFFSGNLAPDKAADILKAMAAAVERMQPEAKAA